jgi:hypothetical protein
MRVVALGLLLLGGAASADWAKLLGKEAPDLEATWLRACDGISFDVREGRAVVVVFWSASEKSAAPWRPTRSIRSTAPGSSPMPTS